MPTCIPACYGMIGVVQRKGKEFASTQALRKETIGEDNVRKGKELRARIYRGVGNSEIFDLMNVYFTDIYKSNSNPGLLTYVSDHTSVTYSTVFTWGYLIAKANEEVFQPEQSHLIIASAIIGLGATRQTKSHIKATLGVGNSVECVKAVVKAVAKIAEWADRPITSFNVDELSMQIQAALQR